MLSGKFRPWGELRWVLNRLDKIKWDLTACLSTEDRCIESAKILLDLNSSENIHFVDISDPPNYYEDLSSSKKNSNKSSIDSFGGTRVKYSAAYLLDEDVKIFDLIQDHINLSSGNIILDISSFPKRFFFPFVKVLINEKRIKNFIITYTKPEKYCEEDLSEDPEPWYPLPLFMPTAYPEESYEVGIVGTGFMPFSLPKLLKDKHSDIDLKLFFPFPPGPPNYQRSWEFVRKIEKHYNFKSEDKIVRVNSLDVSEAFNHICSATNYNMSKVLFAPYGPKPVSLAMCIYASLANSPVYYTQPRIYNPNYSTGVKETYAYCIKINNNALFAISS